MSLTKCYFTQNRKAEWKETYRFHDELERHSVCPRQVFREMENTDDLIGIIGLELLSGYFLRENQYIDRG